MEEANAQLEITGMWSRTDLKRPTVEEAYDHYSRPLYRYACALTGSTEDAEDAVQDVFLSLSREKKLKDIESLKAYLFRATRNASYSILRSKCRRNDLCDSLSKDIKETITDFASQSQNSIVLCQNFEQLPVEQREVLVLKIYDEMTFQEIARTTGSSMGTVTSRYRYGIARLRQALEDM